ncbi:MAG: DUF86 domain-containing protein [Armatimonadetes bacterium]|nr:DUF86 domain-containing protein [Armatimonadota bacterium]
MLPDRDRTALLDMLAHAEEAVKLAEGHERGDLDRNRVLCLAVQHLIAIVGEAAGRVSQETRATYSRIRWRPFIRMRNRFIHGYDTVRPRQVWDTVTLDLPALIYELKAALAPEPRAGDKDADDPPSV